MGRKLRTNLEFRPGCGQASLANRLRMKRFTSLGKSTTKKGTKMNLKRRIERMERELKPGELRAVKEGFIDQCGASGALAFDDPSLQEGVDEEGEAIISRWWAVTF